MSTMIQLTLPFAWQMDEWSRILGSTWPLSCRIQPKSERQRNFMHWIAWYGDQIHCSCMQVLLLMGPSLSREGNCIVSFLSFTYQGACE